MLSSICYLQQGEGRILYSQYLQQGEGSTNCQGGRRGRDTFFTFVTDNQNFSGEQKQIKELLQQQIVGNDKKRRIKRKWVKI